MSHSYSTNLYLNLYYWLYTIYYIPYCIRNGTTFSFLFFESYPHSLSVSRDPLSRSCTTEYLWKLAFLILPYLTLPYLTFLYSHSLTELTHFHPHFRNIPRFENVKTALFKINVNILFTNICYKLILFIIHFFYFFIISFIPINYISFVKYTSLFYTYLLTFGLTEFWIENNKK